MIILPSLEIVPAKYNGSTLLSQIPIDGTGDFTVSRTTSPVTGQSTRVNALGQIELVADNVPRLDYFASGGTVGCPALLVEPAATNDIRNNSMVNAVTGTPGTLPTYWSNQLGGGITRTIVGTGTENGVSYIDIRFSGTQNDTTPTDIRFESTTQIVASNGQTWSESVWLKIVAAPNPPTDYRLYMFERDSGGVFIKSATQVASLTTTLTRYSFTRALDGGATVARVQPALTFTTANGSTYDFTIRIGYPQMEQSSVATSVIPTTTAAITRGAETISKTGVSSLIGQTEGTMYAEFFVDFNNRDADIFSVDGGSTSDGFFMSIRFSSVVQLIVRTASANALIFQRAGTYPTGVNKLAVAYKNGDFAICLNGTTVQTNTSYITMPSVSINRASFGRNSLYNLNQQLRIRAAALYPTRLTDTQLALLTSPYTSYSSMASALSYTLG